MMNAWERGLFRFAFSPCYFMCTCICLTWYYVCHIVINNKILFHLNSSNWHLEVKGYGEFLIFEVLKFLEFRNHNYTPDIDFLL